MISKFEDNYRDIDIKHITVSHCDQTKCTDVSGWYVSLSIFPNHCNLYNPSRQPNRICSYEEIVSRITVHFFRSGISCLVRTPNKGQGDIDEIQACMRPSIEQSRHTQQTIDNSLCSISRYARSDGFSLHLISSQVLDCCFYSSGLAQLNSEQKHLSDLWL